MMKFKSPLLGVAAATLLSSSVAHASLVLSGGSILASFTDISAQGFGSVPRVVDLANRYGRDR